MNLGVLLESPQGIQSSSRGGHARALSSRDVAAVLCFPSRESRDLWLSLEAVPRGFPTGLSHVPLWCESILGMKVEAVQGKQDPLEWTETSGGTWNGGTTHEILSPFLWRAPPLEMRREHREFFPEPTGKGYLTARYEAETGLLWMWAGLSCFLSSGHGYVGELLELQQSCEGPFGSSRI